MVRPIETSDGDTVDEFSGNTRRAKQRHGVISVYSNTILNTWFFWVSRYQQLSFGKRQRTGNGVAQASTIKRTW